MEEERGFDPESREHSEGSNDTAKLSDEEDFEENSYYLEMHEEAEFYTNAFKQLGRLSSKPSKKGVIEFIANQIATSHFKTNTDLDHLERIPEKFWDVTIPIMLKDIVKNKLPKIPLLFCLKMDRESLSLTRRQVYLVLCHMFFVTIPDQSHCDISSFQSLYSSKNSKRRSDANLEKLKCLINYFQSIHSLSKKELEQVIVYERLSHPQRQYLKYSKPLLKATITNEEIQTFRGEILVDFANKVLGGGVLFDGAVQEEILFVLHPELMVAKLTCLSLGDNEVVIAYNIRQYSEYTGYSDSFKFKQPCKDSKGSTFVAIDAIDFRGHNPQNQYKEVFIYRQIHKAYVGFHHESKQAKQLIGDVPKDKRKVVTGKWGCGVFGGDPELKFLIQWISCSWASREMVFVNYGETKERNAVYQKVIDKLVGKKTTELRKILSSYYEHRLDIQFEEEQRLKEERQKQDSPKQSMLIEQNPKDTKQQGRRDKDISIFTYILEEWK